MKLPAILSQALVDWHRPTLTPSDPSPKQVRYFFGGTVGTDRLAPQTGQASHLTASFLGVLKEGAISTCMLGVSTLLGAIVSLRVQESRTVLRTSFGPKDHSQEVLSLPRPSSGWSWTLRVCYRPSVRLVLTRLAPLSRTICFFGWAPLHQWWVRNPRGQFLLTQTSCQPPHVQVQNRLFGAWAKLPARM